MPPTADADAALASEQATEATALWAVGDFDAAHQTLQRLDASLPSDAREQLNLWIAGYYADATSSLDAVGKELESWLQSHKPDPTDYSQRNGHAVAAVNYALILFVQQQHAAALPLLEPLFEDIDVLQDGTALCVCVLLLEIYLDSCQLTKAVQVLEYLQGLPAARLCSADEPQAEAPGGSSGPEHGQSAAAGADRPLLQQGSSNADDAGSTSDHATTPQPQPASQQGCDGAVPLSCSLPVVSKTQSPFMQQVWQLVEQQGGKPPSRDLVPLLHLYKARLALACHNHKAAKKEVRGLLAREPDGTAAALLKAQAEVMRQQPKKALKSLAPVLAAAPQATVRCRLQLLNLLAAVHHQLGKHNIAALYLSTALSQHQEAQQQQFQLPKQPASSKQEQQRKQQGKRQQKKQQQGKPAVNEPAEGVVPSKDSSAVARQSPWLLQDMSDALSYNLGLQQLALQDWQAAMECFEAASSKYFTLPQLWLRWAEACVGLYHQQKDSLQSDTVAAAAPGAPAKGKPGTGKASKGQPAGKKQQQQQQQQQASSPEQLLQQAAAHLSTGLVLLQEQQAAAAKQLEAATAAAAAAIAAGESPPQLSGPRWPTANTGAAPTPAADSGGDNTASSSMWPAEASSSSSAAANRDDSDVRYAASSSAQQAAAAVGPSTPVLGDWSTEAGLLAPELAAVKQALLSNQAYVHLLLNQPEEALAAGLDLVACSSMSPQQHYLGTSYAAEALCLLGRVDEAKQQLQSHMELFAQHSRGSAGGAVGMSATTAAAAGGAPEQLSGAAAAGGSTAATQVEGSSSGTVPVAGAQASGAEGVASAATGSIKSHDGSCISCARGVCGSSGPWGSTGGAEAGLSPKAHAAVLHNMSAVLLLQGDYQEAQRHAAMAAAVMDGQQGVVSAGGVLPSSGCGPSVNPQG